MCSWFGHRLVQVLFAWIVSVSLAGSAQTGTPTAGTPSLYLVIPSAQSKGFILGVEKLATQTASVLRVEIVDTEGQRLPPHIVALAGVLLGAAITALTSYLLERGRRSFEERKQLLAGYQPEYRKFLAAWGYSRDTDTLRRAFGVFRAATVVPRRAVFTYERLLTELDRDREKRRSKLIARLIRRLARQLEKAYRT